MHTKNEKICSGRIAVAGLFGAALVLSACDLQRPQTPPALGGAVPTQLELSLGLKEAEWGRYTLSQLTLIKSLQESDDVSDGERRARIAFIKKYLPLGISF